MCAAAIQQPGASDHYVSYPHLRLSRDIYESYTSWCKCWDTKVCVNSNYFAANVDLNHSQVDGTTVLHVLADHRHQYSLSDNPPFVAV
jgi:hypothetical protein